MKVAYQLKQVLEANRQKRQNDREFQHKILTTNQRILKKQLSKFIDEMAFTDWTISTGPTKDGTMKLVVTIK